MSIVTLLPTTLPYSGNTATASAVAPPAPLAPATQSAFKQQMVLVYTSAGQFLDVWRDAPLLAGVKFAINSATSPIRVKLPRSFDDFDEAGTPGAVGTIGQGNIVQYWLYGPGFPTGGLLKFQGVIDKYEPAISESGEESVTVTLVPFDSAVGDNGVVGSITFGTVGVSASYVDPLTMFNWFFNNTNGVTGAPYSSALRLNSGNPTSSGGTATAYTFINQSLGSIFETIRKMLPSNWFWRVNQDKTVTLNVPPSTAQHTFVLGQHIAAPQYSKDWMTLRNVVQVQGNATISCSLTSALTARTPYTSLAVSALPFALVSGQNLILNPNGTNAITVSLSANAAAGATSVSVVSFTTPSGVTMPVGTQVAIVVQATKMGTDISTYGQRLMQVADSRVLDVNTANALAQGLLNQYDQMVLRAPIRVVDYRGDTQTGLGYDIETIAPGDTCLIIDPSASGAPTLWDNAAWDDSDWDYTPGFALDQVMIIYEVNYRWDCVDLTLGSFLPNQDRALYELARSFQDFTLMGN